MATDDDDPADPGYAAVAKYLLYGLSLPERALRSGTALAAGAARESAALLVPQAFQNSKSYAVMIRTMLDFLAEEVGGAAKRDETAARPAKVENFVARKAVGNFVEMANMATFHLSPLFLLAAVSDIAYGSQAYLVELAGELKQHGIIDETSTIHHVDDLLEAVASASRTTAGALDTPPLSIEGLQTTLRDTRDALSLIEPASIVPQAELARLWNDMRDIAAREHVSPLAISGAMTLFALDRLHIVARGALSGVRVAGRLLDRHVIDHYEEAIGEIRRVGLYATLRESSAPYIEATWQNFSTDKTTITEELLNGKLLGQGWRAAGRWLGGS